MKHNNYKNAIQSFEIARAKIRPHMSRPLSAVSLVSLLPAMLGYPEILDRLIDLRMEF